MIRISRDQRVFGLSAVATSVIHAASGDHITFEAFGRDLVRKLRPRRAMKGER